MMEDAAREALRSGGTRDPLLGAIFLAESINQRHGGALVKPWALDELPADFLTQYEILLRVTRDEAQTRSAQTRMESYHRTFRQKHPTYRKYLS